MKLIKLTLHSDKKQDVYVNIEQIGYIIDRGAYTTISITTHNNGGLNVTQDTDEIIDLINEAKVN